MTVYATMKTLKKYQGAPGLLMFSPYTGEEYSATIGDYFMAPKTHKFKDSTGHSMRLGQLLQTKVKGRRTMRIFPL